MRVVVRPFAEPDREVDVTRQLVAAIAEELWRLYGGHQDLNWVEAEHHLRHILSTHAVWEELPPEEQVPRRVEGRPRRCRSAQRARKPPRAAPGFEGGSKRRTKAAPSRPGDAGRTGD